MNGKGDTPRRPAVSPDVVAANWARTFGGERRCAEAERQYVETANAAFNREHARTVAEQDARSSWKRGLWLGMGDRLHDTQPRHGLPENRTPPLAQSDMTPEIVRHGDHFGQDDCTEIGQSEVC